MRKIIQENTMLDTYRLHVAERAALGLPPLPLTAEQVAALVELLKNPPEGEDQVLVALISRSGTAWG